MPELIVSKKDKIFFRVPLTQRKLAIGRSVKNDLTLPEEDISRCHAEITFSDGNYHLKDLSAGGTWVGSNKVDQATLADGHIIGIGDWKLTFKRESPQDQAYEKEITTCITLLKKGPHTKIIQLDSENEKFIVEMPFLEINGPDQKRTRYPIKSDYLTIGTRSECDITLKDEYVSGKHLKICRSENGFYLEDLKSTNGTFVNGTKVSRASLNKASEILVGKTKILFGEEKTCEEIRPFAEDHFCGLVGKTRAMRSLFTKIQRVAPVEETVLIQGETGCGKELVAQAIHQLSPHKNNPYVILNCGAISPHLIESELFGHEKGAFTGAVSRRFGAFEQANGGTLFLDEIGELSLELQPKLLRVLENKTVKRVGGDTEIPVRMRVLAATHQNLKEMVEEGKFREDLYFRLLVIPVVLPPLRNRLEDLELLIPHFMRQVSPALSKSLSPGAMEKLRSYSWPGNIRELRNVILRSLIFCDGPIVEPEHIELTPDMLGEGEKMNLIQIEKEKILEALNKTEGNKAKASDLLGIAKSTLFKKIKEYEIN